MADQDNFIELRNLEIIYKQSGFSIKDFTLKINRGEFVVILGESGCGKTTILNLIAGFLLPSHGDILVNSNSILDLPPGKRKIGMVFQGDALFPNMTVYSNLEFGLISRKVKKDERKKRIQEVLKIIKLEKKENSKPSQLSSGQNQRVELARLLLRDADIWLLDEPLNNLDPIIKEEIKEEIKKFHKYNNVTSIYVTHNQSEAFHLADKILIMKGGEQIQFGTPDELYESPTNLYVASFLYTSGINIFNTKIINRNRPYLNIQGLEIDIPINNVNIDISFVAFRSYEIFEEIPEFIDLKKLISINGKVCSYKINDNMNLVKLEINQGEIIVELPREKKLTIGSQKRIYIRADKLLLFDSKTNRLNETLEFEF